MTVVTHSPHSLTNDSFMDGLIGALASYTTPAKNTLHHMVKLHNFKLLSMGQQVYLVIESFHGLPFAHIVTGPWTKKHKTVSYGSIVLRYVDPATTSVVVLSVGVLMFEGKDDNDNIHRWVVDRLRLFALEESDLCSTTTDSGANVWKAMKRFGASWLP